MVRKLLPAQADPNAATTQNATAAVEEDGRKVVIAFFLALAVYLAMTVGALAFEKVTLDAEHALAAAEMTTQVEATETG